jgi:hypothetical protein
MLRDDTGTQDERIGVDMQAQACSRDSFTRIPRCQVGAELDASGKVATLAIATLAKQSRINTCTPQQHGRTVVTWALNIFRSAASVRGSLRANVSGPADVNTSGPNTIASACTVPVTAFSLLATWSKAPRESGGLDAERSLRDMAAGGGMSTGPVVYTSEHASARGS